MKNIICIIVMMLGLTGCSALHDVTFHNYMEQGRQARDAGDLATAEVAYQRALTNVQWGNLGKDRKAAALHEIGNTKWMLGKYEEAEEYLLSSLTLYEELYPDETNRFRIAYILGDIAWCYLNHNKRLRHSQY